jgi:hypothetical protein
MEPSILASSNTTSRLQNIILCTLVAAVVEFLQNIDLFRKLINRSSYQLLQYTGTQAE